MAGILVGCGRELTSRHSGYSGRMSIMDTVVEPRGAAAPAPGAGPSRSSSPLPGGYLRQFDSFRVLACSAVVLQHSFLWTLTGDNVVGWAFVMLLHFSRNAFFFLSALVLTYAQVTRPRSTVGFWRHRFVQLGVPYLAWTLIYWIYTLIDHGGSWGSAFELLGKDVLSGYYQLYFVVVLLQLYLVFPLVLRLVRASRHHGRLMAVSLGVAVALAADIHWPSSFGAVGRATVWIEHYWPFGRDLLTYQDQFVAGSLVGLHLDQISAFVERWYRQIIAAAGAIGAIATLWYLGAIWVGSTPGRSSDIYQPIAFVWFAAAVAALECGTWWWYRRTQEGRPPRSRALSAEYLASLTGGIYLSHVLFINMVRTGLEDVGLTQHLGWVGYVLVVYTITLTISALFVSLVLRTPLRWVLGGPVRAEQRARLDVGVRTPRVASHEVLPAPATLGGGT